MAICFEHQRAISTRRPRNVVRHDDVISTTCARRCGNRVGGTVQRQRTGCGHVAACADGGVARCRDRRQCKCAAAAQIQIAIAAASRAGGDCTVERERIADRRKIAQRCSTHNTDTDRACRGAANGDRFSTCRSGIDLPTEG